MSVPSAHHPCIYIPYKIIPFHSLERKRVHRVDCTAAVIENLAPDDGYRFYIRSHIHHFQTFYSDAPKLIIFYYSEEIESTGLRSAALRLWSVTVTAVIRDTSTSATRNIHTGTSIEAVTTRQTSEGEKPIDHDSDPTVLNVHYKSILSPADKYIRPVVKIEISCLSLKEPYQIQLEKPRDFEDAYHADTANIEGVYYYAYTLGRVTIRDSLTQSMFDKGIELLQPDPDAMYRFYSAYGYWLVKKERFDEARDKYIAARSYDPERLTVLPSLGYCYERLKDWKNAAIYYKEFMDRAENKESDVYNFTKEALDYVNGKLFMEEE